MHHRSSPQLLPFDCKVVNHCKGVLRKLDVGKRCSVPTAAPVSSAVDGDDSIAGIREGTWCGNFRHFLGRRESR